MKWKWYDIRCWYSNERSNWSDWWVWCMHAHTHTSGIYILYIHYIVYIIGVYIYNIRIYTYTDAYTFYICLFEILVKGNTCAFFLPVAFDLSAMSGWGRFFGTLCGGQAVPWRSPATASLLFRFEMPKVDPDPIRRWPLAARLLKQNLQCIINVWHKILMLISYLCISHNKNQNPIWTAQSYNLGHPIGWQHW